MPFLNSEAKLNSHPHHRVEVVQKPRVPLDVFTAFNKHARTCPRCAKPLDVFTRGEQLCETGHLIAYDIAEVLYSMAGEKAEEYLATTGWVGILVDLTQFSGPVYDLTRALSYYLNERKPAAVRAPVFSAPVRNPVTRHSTHAHDHHHSSSSGHHHHSHKHHSASSSRQQERVTVHHPPRVSGSLRVHVPLQGPSESEYGRAYYEEVYHPNGGRVTTKYYHHQQPSRPTLQRANTIGAEPTSHKTTASTGKSGSKVRFDTEVKYYT